MCDDKDSPWLNDEIKNYFNEKEKLVVSETEEN